MSVIINQTNSNGGKEGVWKSTWNNGQPRYEMSFLQGEKDGSETRWDQRGHKMWRIRWKNGIQDGKEERFNCKGQILHEIMWTDGEKVGNAISYIGNIKQVYGAEHSIGIYDGDFMKAYGEIIDKYMNNN
jgi:antitoxin component YwqK of YwqJK toxin-antitoxin module